MQLGGRRQVNGRGNPSLDEDHPHLREQDAELKSPVVKRGALDANQLADLPLAKTLAWLDNAALAFASATASGDILTFK